MPREGGRPCGCDPKENYVCTGHEAYVDWSETEIEAAGRSHHQPLTVQGPDEDGNIAIRRGRADGDAPEQIEMSRFVVEDLIEELQRRLRARE